MACAGCAGVIRAAAAKLNEGQPFVAILDSDVPADHLENLRTFGLCRNTHFIMLTKRDGDVDLYRDENGSSWTVEIEDLLPESLVRQFLETVPDHRLPLEYLCRRRLVSPRRLKGHWVEKYVLRAKPADGEAKTPKDELIDYAESYLGFDSAAELRKLLEDAIKALRNQGLRTKVKGRALSTPSSDPTRKATRRRA